MSFEVAYKKTMNHEGIYSNDPDDLGGETYKGISRKYNPNWNGWKTVDYYKQFGNFEHLLKNSLSLEEKVEEFYKANYWDVFGCDNFPEELSVLLFDMSVNLGVKRTVHYLQMSLNCLNRDEVLFKDLVEDGMYGKKTYNAISDILLIEIDLTTLLKMINVLRGGHYIQRMRKNHSQEKYARGWFARIEINC